MTSAGFHLLGPHHSIFFLQRASKFEILFFFSSRFFIPVLHPVFTGLQLKAPIRLFHTHTIKQYYTRGSGGAGEGAEFFCHPHPIHDAPTTPPTTLRQLFLLRTFYAHSATQQNRHTHRLGSNGPPLATCPPETHRNLSLVFSSGVTCGGHSGSKYCGCTGPLNSPPRGETTAHKASRHKHTHRNKARTS